MKRTRNYTYFKNKSKGDHIRTLEKIKLKRGSSTKGNPEPTKISSHEKKDKV